jgi:hypothetical protein
MDSSTAPSVPNSDTNSPVKSMESGTQYNAPSNDNAPVKSMDFGTTPPELIQAQL